MYTFSGMWDTYLVALVDPDHLVLPAATIEGAPQHQRVVEGHRRVPVLAPQLRGAFGQEGRVLLDVKLVRRRRGAVHTVASSLGNHLSLGAFGRSGNGLVVISLTLLRAGDDATLDVDSGRAAKCRALLPDPPFLAVR